MSCGSSVCWSDLSGNRVANTSNDPLLSRIGGWVSSEQFLEVAGLDGPTRRSVAYDLLKPGQRQNDGSQRRFTLRRPSSQPKTVATPSRMGLILGLLFAMSRSCWDLDVQANTERQCEHFSNRTTSALSCIAEVQSTHGFAIHGSTRPEVLIESPEVVDGNMSLEERARSMVCAGRSSSQLESEHHGIANLGISVWSSSDEDSSLVPS